MTENEERELNALRDKIAFEWKRMIFWRARNVSFWWNYLLWTISGVILGLVAGDWFYQNHDLATGKAMSNRLFFCFIAGQMGVFIQKILAAWKDKKELAAWREKVLAGFKADVERIHPDSPDIIAKVIRDAEEVTK